MEFKGCWLIDHDENVCEVLGGAVTADGAFIYYRCQDGNIAECRSNDHYVYLPGDRHLAEAKAVLLREEFEEAAA